jgi:hypothetical protein
MNFEWIILKFYFMACFVSKMYQTKKLIRATRMKMNQKENRDSSISTVEPRVLAMLYYIYFFLFIISYYKNK